MQGNQRSCACIGGRWLLVAALTASAHAIGRGSEANAAATSADTDEHESSCRRRWPLRLAHKQSSGSTEGVQEGADDVTALLVARLLYVPAIARVDLRCG